MAKKATAPAVVMTTPDTPAAEAPSKETLANEIRTAAGANTAIATVLQAGQEAAQTIAPVLSEAATGIARTAEAMQTSADGVVAAPSKAILAKTTQGTKFDMEKMMKSAEDFVSFSQGNMEAFMKSSQIWAAGVQDMGKAMAATAQAQVDAAVATMKAMSGVKNLKDAVDLQTTLARSSVETVMAETGKLTDASMKLAEQALAPITARVTLATEKFGRTA